MRSVLPFLAFVAVGGMAFLLPGGAPGDKEEPGPEKALEEWTASFSRNDDASGGGPAARRGAATAPTGAAPAAAPPPTSERR